MLSEQYDALVAMTSRRGATIIRSDAGAVDATYREVLRRLAETDPRR